MNSLSFTNVDDFPYRQDGDANVESTAKVNMSLTSAIDGLNFSHGGNLLLARSSAKKSKMTLKTLITLLNTNRRCTPNNR